MNVLEAKIAGQTTEFVNKILEKVKAGVGSGGLDEIWTASCPVPCWSKYNVHVSSSSVQ